MVIFEYDVALSPTIQRRMRIKTYSFDNLFFIYRNIYSIYIKLIKESRASFFSQIKKINK